MPVIFKQTPCNKRISYTSNLLINHKDIVINCFMIRKKIPEKKTIQNKIK